MKPIVRHADQDVQALFIRGVARAACEQRFEDVDGSSELAALEERKTKIESQGRERRVQRQGLLVEGYGLIKMLLARFEKSEVRVGFGIVRMRFKESTPGRGGLIIAALLLQGDGIFPRGVPGRAGLCRIHGEADQEP